MATVFRTVAGQPIEDAIGGDPDVQLSISRYAFEIKAFADAFLIEARDHSLSIGRRVDFDAFVSIEKDSGQGQDSGWDVVLDDERGDAAAFNIEKGRNVEFIDPETGLPKGAMEGLFLLERAVQAVADRHRSELRGG